MERRQSSLESTCKGAVLRAGPSAMNLAGVIAGAVPIMGDSSAGLDVLQCMSWRMVAAS
jgi:Cu/Ag efflux pump CusA